jgi:hypothetical protein
MLSSFPVVCPQEDCRWSGNLIPSQVRGGTGRGHGGAICLVPVPALPAGLDGPATQRQGRGDAAQRSRRGGSHGSRRVTK